MTSTTWLIWVMLESSPMRRVFDSLPILGVPDPEEVGLGRNEGKGREALLEGGLDLLEPGGRVPLPLEVAAHVGGGAGLGADRGAEEVYVHVRGVVPEQARILVYPAQREGGAVALACRRVHEEEDVVAHPGAEHLGHRSGDEDPVALHAVGPAGHVIEGAEIPLLAVPRYARHHAQVHRIAAEAQENVGAIVDARRDAHGPAGHRLEDVHDLSRVLDYQVAVLDVAEYGEVPSIINLGLVLEALPHAAEGSVHDGYYGAAEGDRDGEHAVPRLLPEQIAQGDPGAVAHPYSVAMARTGCILRASLTG